MKKYGLQIRAPASQQKKQGGRPPLPPPAGFRDDDDDEDTERAVSRPAIKNRAMKEIEEQHKKMLEEDPSIFDYDAVYDEMKQDVVRPRAQDRVERKPKYIMNLMKKAEERQREHEIVYEKKLVKERNKEDHLYADKDKFVTGAYKKKLAEQAKWMEEERIRQLREEKEDVTKKDDLTDFYFNIGKDVGYGARSVDLKKPEKHLESKKAENHHESKKAENHLESKKPETQHESVKHEDAGPARSSPVDLGTQAESSSVQEHPKPILSTSESEDANALRFPDIPVQEKAFFSATAAAAVPVPTEQPKRDHKRSQDAVAAARERFLARKKAKEQS